MLFPLFNGKIILQSITKEQAEGLKGSEFIELEGDELDGVFDSSFLETYTRPKGYAKHPVYAKLKPVKEKVISTEVKKKLKALV